MKIIFGLLLCLASVSLTYSQSHSGTYRRADKTGEIIIRDTLNGRSRNIKFSISLHGLKFGSCMGDLKGTAKFINQNTFTYQQSPDGDDETQACSLKFVFSDHKLTIEETGCSAFHGASCEFEGLYLKRK